MALPLGQWSLWWQLGLQSAPSRFTRLPGKEQKGQLGPEVDILAPGVTQAGESEAMGTGEENQPPGEASDLRSSELLSPGPALPLCAGPGGAGTCSRSLRVMGNF